MVILRKQFHFFMMVLSGMLSETTPAKGNKPLSKNVPKRKRISNR